MSEIKIHMLEKAPKGYYGEDVASEEESFSSLQAMGVDEVYYWYISGSYEGTGYLIARKGEQWFEHSMSHCSCYGPICHFEMKTPYSSPREILEKASQGYRDEVEPLVLLAEKHLTPQGAKS